MAAPSPRGRAVEVLREVFERRRRAKDSLAEKERGLSTADADLLRRIVLGVLREKSALDAELQGASRPPLGRLIPGLREILEVALYQIHHLDRVPDYAAVNEAVGQAKAAGGPGAGKLANAVLRTILRSPPPLPAGEGRGEGDASFETLSVRYSHPPFLVSRWLERFGREKTLEILEADNASSPLDLMANPRQTTREALLRELAAEGVSCEPSAISPLGATVLSGNPIRSRLFAAGHFTVQDIGSQVLPLLLPAAGDLLDAAAAPGGKSFAALALGRARRVFSMDFSTERLRQLAENRERLGMPEARPVAGDVASPPLPPESFSRILFDAPCSGTGTLRKNPEIRYRITPEAVERLSGAQGRGLEAAAGLLAPGGFLLYATCSLEAEENERVVERVLARRPEFEAAPIAASEPLSAFVRGNRFQILPGATSDGFTAHLLRRR